MKIPLHNLNKREKIMFMINFIIGGLCVAILPTGIDLYLKIPSLLSFIFFFYYAFSVFIKIYRTELTLLSRFFIILAWLVFVSLIVIFISLFMAGSETAWLRKEGIFTLLAGAFFEACIGLVITSPIWLTLAIVNFLILPRAKNPQGKH